MKRKGKFFLRIDARGKGGHIIIYRACAKRLLEEAIMYIYAYEGTDS